MCDDVLFTKEKMFIIYMVRLCQEHQLTPTEKGEAGGVTLRFGPQFSFYPLNLLPLYCFYRVSIGLYVKPF